MADTGVILGIGGIVGTLAGALSANATTYVIERRKDRQQQLQAEREALQAARLVTIELQDAESILSGAIVSRSFWRDAPVREAWRTYVPLLASTLTGDEFQRVALAYDNLRKELALAHDGELEASLYVESFTETRETVTDARHALRRLAALDESGG